MKIRKHTHNNILKADSRLFLRARHDVAEGHTSLIIKANDTYVLVIAIRAYQILAEIGLEKLWRTSDRYQYMISETLLTLTKQRESLSSTPLLDVMLCRFPMERVKVKQDKRLYILKLQRYLPTSVRILQ